MKPVSPARIAAVLPHVARQVAAMIELQLGTGMRPDEPCMMRHGDIDRCAEPRVYRPPTHKTAYRGDTREVYLSPRARGEPWCHSASRTQPRTPTCSRRRRPRQERRGAMSKARKTPPCCGKLPGSNRAKRRRRRPPGPRYTPDSYRRAIERGCDAAFPLPAELENGQVQNRL